MAVAALVLGCLVSLPARAVAAVPTEGRAWELVTPGEPVSAQVNLPAPVDPSGDSIVYLTYGPLRGAQSGVAASLNRATRGPTGWTSSPLSFPVGTPLSTKSVFEFHLVENILPVVPASHGADPFSFVLSEVPLSSEPIPEGHDVLYRRLPDGSFALVAVLEEDIETLFYFKVSGGFVEPSANDEVVVFAAKEHLFPSDANRTSGHSIYESSGSQVRQVDVGGGGSSVSACGSTVSHNNGVSSNGRRIFFASPPSRSSCPGPTEVYLRENGATTTEISASQCTRSGCGPEENVNFVGATPNGEFAYLTTTQELTNDDHNTRFDLYSYDVADGKLTLLSGGEESGYGEVSAPTETGEAWGPVVFPSDDGDYVYFYANGGSLVQGDGAISGENLYVHGPDGLRVVAPAVPIQSRPEESLQLSHSGEVALFETTYPIAEGDTDNSTDVYLYDAGDGSLTWISKGPSGGNGPFDARMGAHAEQEPVANKELFYRSLSEDGRDVFFTTEESLVPEDVNSKVDVYEWKEGRVGLISSGTGDQNAAFYGTSPDGGTAFFQTQQTLLPADRDGGESDVYAARIGGGFPESSPPAPPCESACLPAPPARAPRPEPASARLASGPGGIRFLRLIRTGGAKGATPGWALVLRLPGPGRVSIATATSRGGAKATVAGAATVVESGVARVPLRLSAALERALREGHPTKVRLAIREGKRKLTHTVRLAAGGSR